MTTLCDPNPPPPFIQSEGFLYAQSPRLRVMSLRNNGILCMGFAHNKASSFLLASFIMDSLKRATLLGSDFRLAL